MVTTAGGVIDSKGLGLMGFELIAEEKIRDAIENGAFSNLGTTGKPLQKSNDDYAGEDWLSLHVLESNGFLPEWLELRKHVYLEREGVVQAMREWEDAIALTGSTVHALPIRAGEIYRKKEVDQRQDRPPQYSLSIVRSRTRPISRRLDAEANELIRPGMCRGQRKRPGPDTSSSPGLVDRQEPTLRGTFPRQR